MNIIFMGTPEFAVPPLKELDDKYQIKLVLTQPDKEKGRGKKVQVSPVKEEALKRGIRVLQPIKLRQDKETIEEIRKIEPDFIIVVAYGQILSEEVLNIPKYGCINLHASLLPKLRGAAPLNYALIEGHQESGSTTMLMDKGLDTGDMLLRESLTIDDSMDLKELHDTLSMRGGNLLIRTIEGILDGSIERIKQNDEESSYAHMIDKDTCNIDWSKPAKEINNLIRGLSPVPAAFSYLGEDRVKILKASYLENDYEEPGHIIEVSGNGILVATGKGSLLITKLQYPGKKPMEVKDFLNGNEITENLFRRSVE